MRQRTYTTTVKLSGTTTQSKKPGAWQEVDELLGTSLPMDETEQDKVIQQFETLHAKESRQWKAVFGAGAFLLGAFYVYAAVSQQSRPWDVRYTAEFKTVTTHQAVVLVLALQGASLLGSAFGLLKDLPKPGEFERSCMPASLQRQTALWLADAGSLLGAIYWGHCMHAMINKYGYKVGSRWELLWLPLAPLALCLLCHYITAALANTAKQVLSLKHMKYNFKKV